MEIISKVSKRINVIKNKLDNISGLDGDFVFNRLLVLDKFIDVLLNDINNYLFEDVLNGTIFKDNTIEE